MGGVGRRRLGRPPLLPVKPLTAREARLLENLERGFGWRLLAGPLVGAIGGLVFAYVLSSQGGRFILGDTSPAYARLEAAVGPTPAFYLLCMGAFMGLGLFALVIMLGRLGRIRAGLRARRDAAGVVPEGTR